MQKYLILVLISTLFCTVSSDYTTHDVVQPCGSTYDLTCVRKYFTENGRCSVINNVRETSEHVHNHLIHIPKINVTVFLRRFKLSQMDGVIESFYLDKKTGQLVMSVQLKQILCEAPETMFAVSQKGKEPKVVTEYTNVTYSIAITTVIQTSNGITTEALKEAKYSAYVLNNDSPYYIGPKFTNSKDPVIRAVVEGIKDNLSVVIKEILVSQSSLFFLAYLQNYVCDFDLKSIHNYEPPVFTSGNEIDVNDEKLYTKPCDLDDDVTACVNKFFEEQGTCTVVNNHDDKAVFRKMYTVHVPINNSTAILKDAELSGLKGNVEQFYINKKTGNLVMSVAFEGIKTYSPEIPLYTYQRGQPPKLVADAAEIKYPVVLTAVIPMNEGLNKQAFKKAYVSPYLTKPTEFTKIGPKFTENKDTQIVEILKVLETNPTTVGQELLVTEAHSLFLAYLQNYVCDFGVPLTL